MPDEFDIANIPSNARVLKDDAAYVQQIWLSQGLEGFYVFDVTHFGRTSYVENLVFN